eukprot:5487899-Pleurochrysis_carterae.AAC.1
MGPAPSLPRPAVRVVVAARECPCNAVCAHSSPKGGWLRPPREQCLHVLPPCISHPRARPQLCVCQCALINLRDVRVPAPSLYYCLRALLSQHCVK